MGDLVRVVLYGVLPALAGALLLVGLFGPRLLGLCAGGGLVAAIGLLRNRRPPWPHELWAGNNDGHYWLAWGVFAAGLVAALAQRRAPRWLWLPGGLLLLGGQGFLMLTTRRARMGGSEAVAVHALAAALCAAVWLAVRRGLARRGSATVLWLLCACLVGDSVVLLLSGSALQGQLAGAVAAAFGSAAGTALWRQPFAVGPEQALPFAAAHCGLLLAGQQLSELTALPAVLAAAAPLALALVGAEAAGVGSKGRFAAAVALMLALLGGAVWIVLAQQR